MKKILFTAAAAVATMQMLAAHAVSAEHVPFRFAPKARVEQKNTAGAAFETTGIRRANLLKAPVVEAHSLPPASYVGHLDGPNGETWFYTLDKESTIVDHGTWKEELISGYNIVVYNAAFEPVGSVQDKVELREGETRVAAVMVGSAITQKFFNTDNNYELMVCISCNTADYVNTYRTLAYSLIVDTPSVAAIAEVPGYYTSVVNTARDAWSEKIWMTFLTEEEAAEENQMVGEVPNTMDYVFTTYRYASWSGFGDPMLECRVPSISVGGENAVPFVANVKDGVPWFAVNRLKYCWFENPFDYANENPTPGNELLIDLYTLPSSWSSTVEKFSTTHVPLNTTADNRFFLYLGAFSYDNDVALEGYTTDDTPAFIITKENYQSASDGYSYDYVVYKSAAKGSDAEGEHILDLADNVTSGTFMSDVAGYDPQVMFVKSDGTGAVFDFVNLLTGEVEASIPMDADDMTLTASTDRIAFGDSYLYVSAQTSGESQPNGDVYTHVAYFNTDGNIHHVDKLNLGKLVDYASVYIAADAFDPYLFNLDDKREYMVLVKRRKSGSAAGNHEEFMIVSEDPADAPLFVYAPTEELGSLVSVFYANIGTDTPRLIMITQNAEGKLVNSAYNLPLQLFDEGDGTLENPYIITTAGGLAQLKSAPGAHYALGCDIDAANANLVINNFTFTGSLDGRGHSVSNLSLSGYPIVPNLMRPENATGDQRVAIVQNINFIDPKFEAANDECGMLVGQMIGGVVRNVHIYGGKMNSQAELSGLVGGAYSGSVIENSSVNAELKGSEESSIGGICHHTRTGSVIRACAFSGSIEGGEGVGGIVSDFGNADDIIENCHVKADIKGKNTIGGIAASSSRGIIRFCHVQGSITATEAPRWGGGLKTGGIVGELQPAMSSFRSDDNESAGDVTPISVVEGCYVSLSAMSYTGDDLPNESYSGQNDTMHRIVGSSVANMEPEIIDYDENWEPIFGDPYTPEAGLKNNYATESLKACSTTVESALDSTEGLGIDPYETGIGFFSELGWLYGFDAENPWSYTGNQMYPLLYFEGGLLIVDPAETTISVNDEININLTMKGGEISMDDLGGFSMEISDESILEVLDMGILGSETAPEGVYITVKGAKEGKAEVTLNLSGKSVKSVISVKDNSSSGVEDVLGTDSSIRFDGRTVTAPECLIEVYTTMGIKVLVANGSADLGLLGQGIYIVSSTTSAGNVSTIKVRVQ